MKYKSNFIIQFFIVVFALCVYLACNGPSNNPQAKSGIGKLGIVERFY